ncbi:BRO-N domain-containing protein [Psychrobacter sp. I-STPA10]|uniref:BRO-N domain-containing protein n=1 Tax=Psychrobacter sp. I-STPA10 TaxID=2585769 RepID=UPI001E387537|nr:BRO family protein [Psychrobacter sp. I-STPA10]
MNTLTFNQTNLNPINRNDGQIWLTASELANALDYKSSKSVTNLYNANSDEFTSGMTEVIESVTSSKIKGLTAKVRIFSLRGCHLLAMFARTKIAKEFRKWVLDILDRETRTDSTQRKTLVSACTKLSAGSDLSISKVYNLVGEHFGYSGGIVNIPTPLLPEAVAFVYDMILARQKGGTNQDYQNSLRLLGLSKVEDINHAVGVARKQLCQFEHALKALDCAIEVIQTHNHTNGSVFKSLENEFIGIDR